MEEYSRVIKYCQLIGQRKLATVNSFRADVLSVSTLSKSSKVAIRASALRHSPDEGLTLERSDLKLFKVVDLRYQLS